MSHRHANRSRAMKNEHKKALEQYVFVAYHLKGMTLAD